MRRDDAREDVRPPADGARVMPVRETGGGAAPKDSDVTIEAVHLYPVTMNTYGDRGNVIALTRRAEWRGIGLRWHPVELGEPCPEHADLVFIGGGQDRVQRAVAEDLRRRRDWLEEQVRGGMVVLGVCAGLQLLGRRYVTADGEELMGLGLLDLETLAARPGEWRLVGNVVAEVATEAGLRLLVGFENHGGRTHLGAAAPLGRVRVGNGNNGRDGTEGARSGSITASYLHGPLLPKNAWLTDQLLAQALKHAGGDPRSLRPLDDSFEDAAHREAILRAETDASAARRRRSAAEAAARRRLVRVAVSARGWHAKARAVARGVGARIRA